MDIIERKTHNDKIQKFLDKGTGEVILYNSGSSSQNFHVVPCDIFKTYIEEQELKNDYLEKKILELEEELKDFKYIYEINRRFDEISYI